MDCIARPQDASCVNFEFPGAQALVQDFCTSMDNMPGCTIRTICNNPTYNASTGNNGVCTYFSLAVDLCFDMPSMEGPRCANLTKMCHPTTGTSVVAQCNTPDLIATMPKFTQLTANITLLCATNPPSSDLCSRCTSANHWDCDLLGTFTSLCVLASDRPECARAPLFCNAIASYDWPLCNYVEPSSAPATPTAPLAPGQLDCPRSPMNQACANYRIPNPDGVVAEMCEMMGNMPACSVKKVCSDKKYSSSQYCKASSLMADVCTDMTMGVQGCVDYKDMCVPNSVVKECSEPSLKSVLPTTSQARALVNDICTSMPMSDCDSCKTGPNAAPCDYFKVYSNLCIAMPGMSQCKAWSTFCTVVPKWPFCSSDSAGIPEMRMYFHTGFVDYVLFYGWVPRNAVQYAFTWIAIAVAGVLLEFIKFIRARLEKHWLRRHPGYVLAVNSSEEEQNHSLHIKHSSSSSSSSEYPPWDFRVDLPRSILAAFELIWSYALMLVAMTFNVGLFFAVIFGCFVGTLIFGRFLVTLPKPKTVSCH